MKDVKMEQALAEMAKQVGTIYHFTKQDYIDDILDSGILTSHSGHVSATRNHNLVMNFGHTMKHPTLPSFANGYSTLIS